MLKITLDPTFKADVEITVPGQDKPGTIPLTMKYRGRDAFQQFAEELKSAAGKKKTVAESFPDFVEDWGLKEEFNKENIETFLNNYPAAYQEILTKYSELLLVSRLKN